MYVDEAHNKIITKFKNFNNLAERFPRGSVFFNSENYEIGTLLPNGNALSFAESGPRLTLAFLLQAATQGFCKFWGFSYKLTRV